ncbi:MAG: flagellar basal body rod protein FlgC [Planctomycetes bacterium]|nr:flagellar basal body rod protein FlgC [Planctomycetota bacterium]
MQVSGTFGPIDIAISGIRAQDENIKLISSNVANAQTTDNGTGQPYRRVEAIFKTDSDGIGGVILERAAPDMSPFIKIQKPGHPNADSEGNVSMPNVSLPIEMMNLTMATRAYQANTAILKRYQKMVNSVLELLR